MHHFNGHFYQVNLDQQVAALIFEGVPEAEIFMASCHRSAVL